MKPSYEADKFRNPSFNLYGVKLGYFKASAAFALLYPA